MISLATYAVMLKTFDWAYTYSDDTRVYMAGADYKRRLHDISAQSDDHAVLFNYAYVRFHCG